MFGTSILEHYLEARTRAVLYLVTSALTFKARKPAFIGK